MLSLQGCWGRCRNCRAYQSVVRYASWACGSAGLRVCRSLCSQCKFVKTGPVGPTGMCVCLSHRTGSKSLDEHTQAPGSVPALASHQVMLLPTSRRVLSCVGPDQCWRLRGHTAAPGPAQPPAAGLLVTLSGFCFPSLTQQFNSPKHLHVPHWGKFRN